MTYEELKKFVSELQEKLQNGEMQESTHQINNLVGIITRKFTPKFKVFFITDGTKYIIFQEEENSHGIIATFKGDKLQKIQLIRGVIPMEFTHKEKTTS